MTTFWGLIAEQNKSYAQVVERTFRLANIALGPNPSKGRTTLSIEVDGEDYPLCSLTTDKIEQQAMDMMFMEGEQIKFKTVGPNVLSLTGNYLPDDEEGGDYEIDSEEEEEAELAELMEGESDGEIVTDGAAQLLDGEDDDEEEDDEDMEFDEEEIENLKKAVKAHYGIEGELSDEKLAELMMQDEEMSQDDDEDMTEAEEEEEEVKEEMPKETKRKSAEQPKPVEKKKKDNQGKAVEATKKVEQKKQEPTPAKKAEKVQEEEKTPVAKSDKKTLPGGLIVEDVLVGNGAMAKKNKRVSMRYIGKLTNGKVFDKNSSGKPFSFRLGRGEVIKGWDQGIEGMKVGGTRRLTIPAKLAYGAQGAPPDIPKNATLEFEVKLLGVN